MARGQAPDHDRRWSDCSGDIAKRKGDVNFEEHAAKPLLRAAGIETPRGVLAHSADEAAQAAKQLGPCVVKAQVATGKRGKAGGIRLAADPEAARAAANAILGMSIGEHRVETAARRGAGGIRARDVRSRARRSGVQGTAAAVLGGRRHGHRGNRGQTSRCAGPLTGGYPHGPGRKAAGRRAAGFAALRSGGPRRAAGPAVPRLRRERRGAAGDQSAGGRQGRPAGGARLQARHRRQRAAAPPRAGEIRHARVAHHARGSRRRPSASSSSSSTAASACSPTAPDSP